MSRVLRVLALLGLLHAAPAAAELAVWVDGEGHTHVTDDPSLVPEGAARRDGADGTPGSLWEDGLLDPQGPADPGDSSREEDRVRRQVREAAADLQRGETARAAATLEAVLRLDPSCPEAHWYLALLDRQRGRFDAAERHLEAFLAEAGDRFDPWRASARRQLDALSDERRLLASTGPLELVSAESPNFRVHYDRDLGQASPDYARRVLAYLEQARVEVGGLLGVLPREPTGVVFYGKGAYLRAHRHRFSFATVGFFDGRIHVVSAAHPAADLRALLFHEFTHATFREHTGGDRPFWLNEGLAELAERASRGRSGPTRAEQAALRDAIVSGGWIPLGELSASFRGLDDTRARLAYLEAAAAAAHLVRRSDAAGRGALLSTLGAGGSADTSLRRIAGVDTDGLDAAVRAAILAEFPDY